LFKFRITLLLR